MGGKNDAADQRIVLNDVMDQQNVSIDPDRSNARLRQAKAAEHSRPAPSDCTRPASSQESARAG